MIEEVKRQLSEGVEIRMQTAAKCSAQIAAAAQALIDAFAGGNKLLICGNGGSAADSQHIAAELVWRFKKERKALPAIALTTDTSLITALTNDSAFEFLFKRQVEALGKKGDVLIAISTSGTSKNIVEAALEARKAGMKVIGLSGRNGGKLKSLADICICVPADGTDRIQEMHIAIGHIICDLVERKLFS